MTFQTFIVACLVVGVVCCARGFADVGAGGAAGIVFPGEGWVEATPGSQGFDGVKLEKALRDLPGNVLVTRRGLVVGAKGDVGRPRSILSVSKSVTALIYGTLLQQGKVKLDDLVPGSDTPPSGKPEATWRQFLSMTSDYGLTPHEPGKHVAYNNEGVHFYGSAMARMHFDNKPPLEVMQLALWDHIGRQDPVKFNGQWGGWGGGWSISARDLARLGLLVLAEGKWKDKQLIPADFIRELYKNQIPEDATVATSFGTGGLGSGDDTSFNQLGPSKGMKGSYSFGWWRRNRASEPDLPEAIWALGKFGNFIVVCPSEQIVIGVSNHVEPYPGGALYLRAVLSAMEGSKVAAPTPWRYTVADMEGDKFLINGLVTLKGKKWRGMDVEGLLPNSRMVQGIFDDLNPETRKNWNYPDGKAYDADRNTSEFVAAMQSWYDHGLHAFTINLQGGSPYGYGNTQPWINSAFAPDGSLREAYMNRLDRILAKADEIGMAVIVGYFYFGQEPFMESDEAIRTATRNATDWLVARGYGNVLVEIANEADMKQYKHDAVKPEHTRGLFEIVRERSKGKVKNAIGRFYVSTSLKGGAEPSAELVKQVDFVLLHGNGVKQAERIEAMVDNVRKLETYRNQPIVFNEDDHFDFDKPENYFVSATKKHASWGYFDYRMKDEKFEDGYQSIPVDWTINSERKRAFFNAVKEMISIAAP